MNTPVSSATGCSGAVAPFAIESGNAVHALVLNAAYFVVIGVIALWGAGVWLAMQAQFKTFMGRRFSSKRANQGTGEEA